MKFSPSVFFFDTEIAKSLYAKFPPRKPEYDSYHNVIRDWWIICWKGQWEDSKKIIGASVTDNEKRWKKDPMDDYHPVKELYEQVKDADVLVGHNMDKFDWMKFMARVTYHKMLPLAKPKIIDTWQMAKSIGQYTSNSLGYLTEHHGLATKASNRGNDMWNDVVRHIINRDDKAARAVIKEVMDYCGPDVTACKELYHFLLPYAPQRFRLNANLYRGEGVECCPVCEHEELMQRGYALTVTGKYPRYQCKKCGSWCQGKKSVAKVSLK